MAPPVMEPTNVATAGQYEDASVSNADFGTADSGSSYHSQFAVAMKNASRTR
jgi:hypothetical protein